MLPWPVVLYRCETWYLTLWEKYRVRIIPFYNRVLREIFQRKRYEVTELQKTT
jgi:hypothetical protein